MTIVSHAGRFGASRRLGTFARKILSRRYRDDGRPRYAILFEPHRIPYSHVFPFILHQFEIEQRYGVQIRYFNVDDLESIDFSAIDFVVLELWFTRGSGYFENIFDLCVNNGVESIGFIDSFAHNDVRLSKIFGDNIKYYFKKSLFKEYNNYRFETLGDTNLTDYYSKLYGIDDKKTMWEIPDGFLDKLRTFPNFFTAPELHGLFMNRTFEDARRTRRDIDVHARFATQGSPWYTAMRSNAEKAITSLTGVTSVTGNSVGWRKFLMELRRSRVCFSPFGYGEICWRDIEAIACGSVLMKPDMGHLITRPDIYIPWETYVPVAWDFQDVPEKVRWIIDHPEESMRMCENAFNIIRSYLVDAVFVDEMSLIFDRRKAGG